MRAGVQAQATDVMQQTEQAHKEAKECRMNAADCGSKESALGPPHKRVLLGSRQQGKRAAVLWWLHGQHNNT